MPKENMVVVGYVRVSTENQLDTPELIPSAERFLQAVEDYKNGFDTGDTDKRFSINYALTGAVLFPALFHLPSSVPRL